MQKITVRLPEEMLRKIERVAAESDTNRSEITRRMVQTWLEEKGALERVSSSNPSSENLENGSSELEESNSEKDRLFTQ